MVSLYIPEAGLHNCMEAGGVEPKRAERPFSWACVHLLAETATALCIVSKGYCSLLLYSDVESNRGEGRGGHGNPPKRAADEKDRKRRKKMNMQPNSILNPEDRTGTNRCAR